MRQVWRNTTELVHQHDRLLSDHHHVLHHAAHKKVGKRLENVENITMMLFGRNDIQNTEVDQDVYNKEKKCQSIGRRRFNTYESDDEVNSLERPQSVNNILQQQDSVQYLMFQKYIIIYLSFVTIDHCFFR